MKGSSCSSCSTAQRKPWWYQPSEELDGRDRVEMHAQPQDHELMKFTELSPVRGKAVAEVLALLALLALLETFIAQCQGSYPK
jgi:hypothetical protein